MKLEDGLIQAKTRLQTLGIAIQAANEAELEHEQVSNGLFRKIQKLCLHSFENYLGNHHTFKKRRFWSRNRCPWAISSNKTRSTRFRCSTFFIPGTFL